MQLTEDFLHYLWKYKLYDKQSLITTAGLPVQVLNTGLHNEDAGPDFVNSRVKINNQIWAGTIEIHKKASDWQQHGHHKDPAYNNVILHIVHKEDADTTTQNNRQIPTMQLKFAPKLFENYKHYQESKKQPPCADDLSFVNKFQLQNWLDALLIERVEDKTNNIKQLLKYTNNNQEEAFYILMASAFGGKVNAMAFELMAKSLSLTILHKHQDNLFQIQALVLGQAGLLEIENPQEEYVKNLIKEYTFLKTKYKLKNIELHLWKYLRIRPANFPDIRLAQFATLIHKSSRLLSKILEINDLNDLVKVFDFQLPEYWDTHYRIDKKSTKRIKKLGQSAILSVIINTIIPTLFLYAKEKSQPEFQEKAIRILEQIPAENNKIVKAWIQAGIKPKNASQTQAILQLNKKYCTAKKCLKCRIGNQLITNKI